MLKEHTDREGVKKVRDKFIFIVHNRFTCGKINTMKANHP